MLSKRPRCRHAVALAQAGLARSYRYTAVSVRHCALSTSRSSLSPPNAKLTLPSSGKGVLLPWGLSWCPTPDSGTATGAEVVAGLPRHLCARQATQAEGCGHGVHGNVQMGIGFNAAVSSAQRVCGWGFGHGWQRADASTAKKVSARPEEAGHAQARPTRASASCLALHLARHLARCRGCRVAGTGAWRACSRHPVRRATHGGSRGGGCACGGTSKGVGGPSNVAAAVAAAAAAAAAAAVT